jgi:hypothetical protein
MANALYATGRNAFLSAAINWTTDNIKCILVNTSLYTKNLATDQFLTTISGITGAIIATSANLTSTSASAGIANAATVTFATVASGPAAGALVLYRDTGTGSTSQLIAYIDTATGLPVTPNGGSITVTWDTGANKIFQL